MEIWRHGRRFRKQTVQSAPASLQQDQTERGQHDLADVKSRPRSAKQAEPAGSDLWIGDDFGACRLREHSSILYDTLVRRPQGTTQVRTTASPSGMISQG